MTPRHIIASSVLLLFFVHQAETSQCENAAPRVQPDGTVNDSAPSSSSCGASSEVRPAEQVIMLQRGAMIIALADDKDLDEAYLDVMPVQKQRDTWAQARPTKLRKDLGASLNAEGDLMTFVSAIFTYGFATLCLCALFSCFLRPSQPRVYSDNVQRNKEILGFAPDDSYLGWACASWRLTIDDIQRTCGLDCALLMEYCDIQMRICVTVGLPLAIVFCPMHYFLGGGEAGKDRLSWIGMGNVSEGNWMYWAHALAVCAVIWRVKSMVYSSMGHFMERRTVWLQELPEPRSTTLLVEGIPRKYVGPDDTEPRSLCSDTNLKSFFSQMFSADKIESVYVVRKTAELTQNIAKLEKAEYYLAKTEQQWETDGRKEDKRPKHRDYMAREVDSITHYTASKKEYSNKVQTEREKINRLALTSSEPEIFTSTGFVTFKKRHDAEIALNQRYHDDDTILMVSTPPDPTDIIYPDLMQDSQQQNCMHFLGYTLVVGLYFAFMPVVFAISCLAELPRLREDFALIDWLVTEIPSMASVLQGVLATLGLQIFLAFYPTILLLIFQNFFSLKANAWAQHKIQVFYFWFLMFFVVLVTALGGTFIGAISTLIHHPAQVFSMLAETMPHATHYYLNFVVLQPVTHFSGLCRWSQFFKFRALSLIYDADAAKALAEPEDPAYYGIGSRSARFSIICAIGLIYGTLTPLIYLFVFADFFVCRIVYGYLMVFTECRKSDLGGAFFVTQMRHIILILVGYGILMVGVLSARAATYGPSALAFLGLLYASVSLHKFDHAFRWERLPFNAFYDAQKRKGQSSAAILSSSWLYPGSSAKLQQGSTKKPGTQVQGRYVQTELLEDAPAFGARKSRLRLGSASKEERASA